MSSNTRAWLQIHFCVLLWGFTAILGKLITLAALPLVLWRMALVGAALCLVPRFWKRIGDLSGRMIAIYAGIGVLVAMHWLTFYGAIKLANASVAATSMALTPVFTSLIEPALAGSRFRVRELAFGLGVIPGVALVVGGTPEGMRIGIAAGVVSVMFVATFASLNKRFIEQGDALAVTGIEMGAGAAFLALVGAVFPTADRVFVMPVASDLVLLLILALGCTLVPYALSLVALRRLSAFATTLAVNMEPVYAILLAIVLLGEQRELDSVFYLGVAIIFATVFSHPLLERRAHLVAGHS